MYPGIPEYFNIEGRGVYTYLTGAASWYLLTMITEVFGVKGDAGRLKIMPRLMLEQFNENGEASIGLFFRGRRLKVCIINSDESEYGRYGIIKACINGDELDLNGGKPGTGSNEISLDVSALSEDKENEIRIILGKKNL